MQFCALLNFGSFGENIFLEAEQRIGLVAEQANFAHNIFTSNLCNTD